MPSVYHFLFCRKENHVLCSLVKEAYRSLRYYNPYSASVTVLALGRLQELPYSNTVLLLTVLPSVDRYTSGELLFLLEGLSLMEISHAMLTAHILKLFTRKMLHLGERASQQYEAKLLEVPNSAAHPVGQQRRSVAFQSCVLYPVLDELSKMIVLIKTYHTESTLHAFLLSLTDTFEAFLFTQHNALFSRYYHEVLLQQNRHVGSGKWEVSGTSELLTLNEGDCDSRFMFVKQVLFLFEAIASIVNSLPEPPFWLLCCLQDVSTDLSAEQLLHLFTMLWDNGLHRVQHGKNEEKGAGVVEQPRDLWLSLSPRNNYRDCFSLLVHRTYHQLICTRFAELVPPSPSLFNDNNNSNNKNATIEKEYMRILDPEMFPHLSAKERANLRRCVLYSIANARHQEGSSRNEKSNKPLASDVDVTPCYLFELTQERALVQCIEVDAREKLKRGEQTGSMSEREPLWESYLLSALTHIHNDTSHPHGVASLFTDVSYVLMSMLLLLQQLHKTEGRCDSATIAKIVHHSCSLLRLVVHLLKKRQAFSQLEEAHILHDVSSILKGLCSDTTSANTFTVRSEEKGPHHGDGSVQLLGWVHEHLAGNDELFVSFVEELSLVASLVTQRWASDQNKRRSKRENPSAEARQQGEARSNSAVLGGHEMTRAPRVSRKRLIETVLLWRAVEQLSATLLAWMCSAAHKSASPGAAKAWHSAHPSSQHTLLSVDGGTTGTDSENRARPYFCQIVCGLMSPNDEGTPFLALLRIKTDRLDDPQRKDLAISFIRTLYTMTSMLSSLSCPLRDDALWVGRAQWSLALRDAVGEVMRSTDLLAATQFVRQQVDLFGVYWTLDSSDSILDVASGKQLWMDIAQRLLTACFAFEAGVPDGSHPTTAILPPETLVELELLLHSVLQWHPFFRTSGSIVNQCQRIRARRGDVHVSSGCKAPHSSFAHSDKELTSTSSLTRFGPPSKESSNVRSGYRSRSTMLYQRSLQENLSLFHTLSPPKAGMETPAVGCSLATSTTSELGEVQQHRRQVSGEEVYHSIVEVLLNTAKQATWTRAQAGHTLAHVYGLSSGWQRRLPLMQRWWHSSLSLRATSAYTNRGTNSSARGGECVHQDNSDASHPFVQMCIHLWGMRAAEMTSNRSEARDAVEGKGAPLAHDGLHLLRWYDTLRYYCTGQTVLRAKPASSSPGSPALTTTTTTTMTTVRAGVTDRPPLLLRSLLMRYRIIASQWANSASAKEEANQLPPNDIETTRVLVQTTLALLGETNEKVDERCERELFATQTREMLEEIESLKSFLHVQVLPHCMAELLSGATGRRACSGPQDAREVADTLDYVLSTMNVYAPFPADMAPLLAALNTLRQVAVNCTKVSSQHTPKNGAEALATHGVFDKTDFTPAARDKEPRITPRAFLKEILFGAALCRRGRKAATGQVVVARTAEAEEDRLFFLFSQLLLEDFPSPQRRPSDNMAGTDSSSWTVLVDTNAQLVAAVYLFALIHTYDPMWPFYPTPEKTRCLQTVRSAILEATSNLGLLLEQQQQLQQEQWFEAETTMTALSLIERDTLSLFS